MIVKIIYGCFIFIASLIFHSDLWAEVSPWKNIDDGLFLGSFQSPKPSILSDFPITILKIDPARFALKLLSASERGQRSRTMKQWCDEFELIAAINASMYQDDHPLKSTGYMKNFEYFNNSHINSQFGAFFLFNPVDSTWPPVRLVDRYAEKNWKDLLEEYLTVIQNYRMISNGKKIGWPQQDRAYRTAVIGLDKSNNVLFIFSRSSFSTHDFIHILLSLPIQILHVMYVEGGPEALLHINFNHEVFMQTQPLKTKGIIYDNNQSTLTLPNVIGITKRHSIH